MWYCWRWWCDYLRHIPHRWFGVATPPRLRDWRWPTLLLPWPSRWLHLPDLVTAYVVPLLLFRLPAPDNSPPVLFTCLTFPVPLLFVIYGRLVTLVITHHCWVTGVPHYHLQFTVRLRMGLPPRYTVASYSGDPSGILTLLWWCCCWSDRWPVDPWWFGDLLVLSADGVTVTPGDLTTTTDYTGMMLLIRYCCCCLFIHWWWWLLLWWYYDIVEDDGGRRCPLFWFTIPTTVDPVVVDLPGNLVIPFPGPGWNGVACRHTCHRWYDTTVRWYLLTLFIAYGVTLLLILVGDLYGVGDRWVLFGPLWFITLYCCYRRWYGIPWQFGDLFQAHIPYHAMTPLVFPIYWRYLVTWWPVFIRYWCGVVDRYSHIGRLRWCRRCYRDCCSCCWHSPLLVPVGGVPHHTHSFLTRWRWPWRLSSCNVIQTDGIVVGDPVLLRFAIAAPLHHVTFGPRYTPLLLPLRFPHVYHTTCPSCATALHHVRCRIHHTRFFPHHTTARVTVPTRVDCVPVRLVGAVGLMDSVLVHRFGYLDLTLRLHDLPRLPISATPPHLRYATAPGFSLLLPVRSVTPVTYTRCRLRTSPRSLRIYLPPAITTGRFTVPRPHIPTLPTTVTHIPPILPPRTHHLCPRVRCWFTLPLLFVTLLVRYVAMDCDLVVVTYVYHVGCDRCGDLGILTPHDSTPRTCLHYPTNWPILRWPTGDDSIGIGDIHSIHWLHYWYCVQWLRYCWPQVTTDDPGRLVLTYGMVVIRLTGIDRRYSFPTLPVSNYCDPVYHLLTYSSHYYGVTFLMVTFGDWVLGKVVTIRWRCWSRWWYVVVLTALMT